MAGQSSQPPCCFHGVQALWVVYISPSVQSRADKVKTESKCSQLRYEDATVSDFFPSFPLFFPIRLQKEQWSLIHYKPCQAQNNLFFFEQGDFINHRVSEHNKNALKFFIIFEGHCVPTLTEASVI